MAKRFNYGRTEQTATRLLEKFNQGVITIMRLTAVPAVNSWEKPTHSSQSWTVNGVKTGGNKTFQDDTGKTYTAWEMMIGVFTETPKITDQFFIDGKPFTVLAVDPITASSNVPVAWTLRIEA